LIYLLYRENKTESEIMELDFKNQVFVSNPEMYDRLFNEEPVIDENEIEQIVPDSEEALKKMMRQLKAEGIIS
jgi:predicted transcriptional regulator